MGFIVDVSVVVAVSTVVSIFVLKNRGITVLDREQGRAYADRWGRFDLRRAG